MTATIIALVSSVVGFIIWLLRRRISESETKESIGLRYEKELHNAIGSGNERDLNLILDKRLSDISRNQSGQSSGKVKEGQGIQDAK